MQTTTLLTDISYEDAILALTGCDDLSQVSEDVLERFEHLSTHPVSINGMNRNELLSSGLFNNYQVEALLDYVKRNGCVLSPMELSAVDGFSQSAVSCLSFFLSFEDGTGPPEKAETESSAGVSAKISSGTHQFRAGARVTGAAGTHRGCILFAAAARTSWSSHFSVPENICWHLGWHKSGPVSGFGLSDFVAGWYNARFGQGLCEWSGTVIESYATASSLMKRPQGITPYSGYAPSGTKFGAALSLRSRHFTVSPFYNMGASIQSELLAGKLRGNAKILAEGTECGLNAAWNHRNGTVGLTSFLRPFSAYACERYALAADFQQTVFGAVLYGECCLRPPEGQPSGPSNSPSGPSNSPSDSPSWPSVSIVFGSRYQSEHFDTGLRCSYGNKEHNFSAASSFVSRSKSHSATMALSASYFPEAVGHTPKGACQLRISAVYKFTGVEKLTFTTRITGRLRALTIFSDLDAPYTSVWQGVRADFRQDVGVNLSPWSINLRFNTLRCMNHSMLGFAECGYKSASGVFQTFVQSGAFLVDDWEDRIYVYQRDAPGNFNISAKYGRGIWASAYFCLKLSRSVRFHLMANFQAYPWARAGDTRTLPALSVNFQTSVRLVPKSVR